MINQAKIKINIFFRFIKKKLSVNLADDFLCTKKKSSWKVVKKIKKKEVDSLLTKNIFTTHLFIAGSVDEKLTI